MEKKEFFRNIDEWYILVDGRPAFFWVADKARFDVVGFGRGNEGHINSCRPWVPKWATKKGTYGLHLTGVIRGPKFNTYRGQVVSAFIDEQVVDVAEAPAKVRVMYYHRGDTVISSHQTEKYRWTAVCGPHVGSHDGRYEYARDIKCGPALLDKLEALIAKRVAEYKLSEGETFSKEPPSVTMSPAVYSNDSRHTDSYYWDGDQDGLIRAIESGDMKVDISVRILDNIGIGWWPGSDGFHMRDDD